MTQKQILYTLSITTLVVFGYMVTGFFAFPSGDDFDYACIGRSTNFFETVLNERTRWNGRYISNFLVIGSPLNIGGIQFYKLMPWLLLSGISIGTFLVFKLIKTGYSFLFSIVSLVLCFSVMPDITEGIYWYTGAVTYIPGGTIFLLSLALLYKYWFSNKKWILALIFPLQFIASGFNEIVPILAAAAFLLIYIFNPKRWEIALLTLFQFSLLYYVISAPGNSVRDSFFTEQHQLFFSFQKAWQYTVRFIGEWMLNPAIYLWVILLSRIKLSENIKQQFKFLRKPIVIFFILVGPTYLAAFGPLWSTGLLGQYRTANLASYFFCISITIVALANLDWLKEKVKINWNSKLVFPLFLVFLLGWKNQVILVKEYMNGSILGFNQEMKSRIEILENHKNKDVYLPTIKNTPKTLFVYPITDQPTDWKNQCYGNYYRTFKVYKKD